MARNYVFTPTFCLHTVTTGSGDMPFGYFLMTFHVLIEIYPLVPFPPSVRERVSDYTRTSLQWTPLTVARTDGSFQFRTIYRRLFPIPYSNSVCTRR